MWPGACSGRVQSWCGSMSSGRMIFGSRRFFAMPSPCSIVPECAVSERRKYPLLRLGDDHPLRAVEPLFGDAPAGCGAARFDLPGTEPEDRGAIAALVPCLQVRRDAGAVDVGLLHDQAREVMAGRDVAG